MPPSASASPWHSGEFRRAWFAMTVNDTGDWVLAVGLPAVVFLETGSGSSTAVVFVAQLVASAVLGPFAGSLVDRWDLRRCLVVTNLAQALVLAPLLTVSGDRIWPAYVVMAAQSTLLQINNPAGVALIPRLVAPDRLTAANAAVTAGGSLARLSGAAIGGLAVAGGGITAIVIIDAASFLTAALAVATIRADTSSAPARRDDERGVRAGLRAIGQNRPLPGLVVVTGISQIAQGAFVVLFVVFILEVLGDDGTALGLIRATMAIGAGIGAAIVARLADRADATALVPAGLAGMGAVSLVFWNAPAVTTDLWVFAVLFALSGLPGAALEIGVMTTIHTYSPRRAIGRTTALLGAVAATGAAFGSLTTGLLIDRIDLSALLNAQATTYAFAAGVALFVLARRSH